MYVSSFILSRKFRSIISMRMDSTRLNDVSGSTKCPRRVLFIRHRLDKELHFFEEGSASYISGPRLRRCIFETVEMRYNQPP